MGFKMKGFNPGRGTKTGSSFTKKNAKVIDGVLYEDTETSPRPNMSEFTDSSGNYVTGMDIDPNFKGGDYELPGEGVDTHTSAPVGYGGNVRYSDAHEKYMGVKDAGAGYGPEEIGLRNKQERLNEQNARDTSKLLREYRDGALPITRESTEYNKENWDVWNSDPNNKRQPGETQAQHRRRFKNDLQDLSNLVDRIETDAQAGYDHSGKYGLNEYESGKYEVNRALEDVRKKNRELDYDRGRNIKIERYSNKLDKFVKEHGYVPDTYWTRKLQEMGEGHIVANAERAAMTPKERKKHDRQTARAEKRSERKASRQERRRARQERRQIRKAERRG
tara:strand:+ start:128 stop:1129 length:1002 start_codon:yes stop_codon:yes gene_type:complete